MEIFLLQHQFWSLTRQNREEETEILYARRYKSQDEIETFLTALLHLPGRSEKNYEKSVKTAAFHAVFEMFTAMPTCSVPSTFCSFGVSAFHARVILLWDLKPALRKVKFS
jgi:hypothetical protein